MKSQKKGTAVVIMTVGYHIKGTIDLIPDARITDFVNDAKGFIAVTDAEVRTIEGRLIYTTPFISVSTSHIELITHADMATRE